MNPVAAFVRTRVTSRKIGRVLTRRIVWATSQLRRAAISITSNIVEGSARSSEAEYVHFLETAYGSAREVEYQVSPAFRLGFLTVVAHQQLSALSVETSKVLNGLLRSLRNS